MSETMPLGSMTWLAQYIMDVHVRAAQTHYDTPNMYSAGLRVLGDQGDMDLSPLAGPRGRDGQVLFQTRLVSDPKVTSVATLPRDLTNSPYDIGKFYLIDEVDAAGHVVNQWAYMWYGTGWRKKMCGAQGDPGPVPNLQLNTGLVEPQKPPTYPDTTSYMSTSGTNAQPSWNFQLAVPQGPTGSAGPVGTMPDVDLSTPPSPYSVLVCTDRFNAAGEQIFAPRSLSNYRPLPYSVPESSFIRYSGAAQSANIGSFTVPDPGFDWTPLVWGHIGARQTQLATRLNTIQTVLVSAYGGTYRLRDALGLLRTPPIAFDASPAEVQAALEAVVGAGNVSVDWGDQYLSYEIEFMGTLQGDVVPALKPDITLLEPEDEASVDVSVKQKGGQNGTTWIQAMSGNPFKIGMRALLGDQTKGVMVARGKGNLSGSVKVMPHYSTQDNLDQAITPVNGYAVVKAGASAAERTLYFNLWNDGVKGYYNFAQTNAQIFVLVNPINVLNSMYAIRAVETSRRGVPRSRKPR